MNEVHIVDDDAAVRDSLAFLFCLGLGLRRRGLHRIAKISYSYL